MACSFSVLVRPDGSILKAYGDIASGIGWDCSNLIRSSIFFVLPRKYHERVRQLLNSTPADHRTEAIRLIHNSRGALTYYFRLRDAGRTAVWLDFISERGKEPRPHCSFPDLTAPDVVERDAYLDRVAAGLNGEAGKVSLTMFEFAGLSGTADAKAGDGVSLRESVENSLGAWSVDGSVGVLDDVSYAIVHEAAVEADVIASDVSAAASERGFADADMSVRTETVRLDSGTRAAGFGDGLAHVVQRFLRGARTLLRQAPRVLRLSEAIREARGGRSLVVAALGRGVRLAHRPVVGLADGNHGFALASAMLRIGSRDRAPAELVDLDLDPALGLQLDLAALDRAVADLTDSLAASGQCGLVILEVQAASLLSPAFAAGLQAHLHAGPVARGSLGFRPVDRNAAMLRRDRLADLRRGLGDEHPIWLKHFPAAVAEESPVFVSGNAFVEISLPFLNSLLRLPDGPRAVSRLLDLWRGLGVYLVTTGLDTPQSAVLARQLGIEFGVGAVFDG